MDFIQNMTTNLLGIAMGFVAVLAAIGWGLQLFGIKGGTAGRYMGSLFGFAVTSIFSFTSGFFAAIGGFYAGVGGARFANRGEEHDVLRSPKKHKGIRICDGGHLSEEASYRHALLCSSSGGGKTSRFVVPSILDSYLSMIITDLSGEIFRVTSKHLTDRGFQIQVINLEEPAKSAKFNPLLRASKNSHLLKKVITGIVKGNISGGDSFWPDSAVSLLNTLASALVQCPERFVTFRNLRYLLALLGDKGNDKLDKFMARHLDDAQFAEFKSFLGTGDNTRTSIIATARAALDQFSDPAIDWITSGDSLDVSALRKNLGAIFLICPETKINFYNAFLNSLYEAIFSELIEKPVNKESKGVAIYMDEAGNQKITDLDVILTTARKRKVSISLVLQELAQLRDRYGADKATTMIQGGIASRLIFPGLAPESCEIFSRALGHSIVRNEKTGAETRKPLMSADEIRMLKGAVLLHGASRPIKIKKMTPFFEDRRLKEYAAKPPLELPEFEIHEPPLLNLDQMIAD